MDKKTKELLKDFHSGTCIRAYDLLGCHRITRRGKAGYVFRVWAPNAKQVCVVGEFNFWNPEDLPMERLDDSVWEVFTTRGYEGCPYKYFISPAPTVPPSIKRIHTPPGPLACRIPPA
ncbi:MAG: hypothetical protein ACLVHV_12330 [Oscillospiraceae bacterium]